MMLGPYKNDRVPAFPSTRLEQIRLVSSLLYMALGSCYLRIGSCLACVYRVMDALGKFREHEGSRKRESNSSLLSALQTSQVHP